MVQGSEVKVDESAMTGESDIIKKTAFDQVMRGSLKNISTSVRLGKRGAGPFLVSGTKVVDGAGIMMVLAVGQNTAQGKLKLLTDQENPPTPLQMKLEAVAEDIGKLGTAVAIVTFVALMVHLGIDLIRGEAVFVSLATLQFVINAFMIGVTIIVVAVPEVLPH